MGTDGELKWQAENDPTEAFLWATQKAISFYADLRFASIACSIRHTLERGKPSGIFDLPRHTNQWREYCYQVNFGSTELEAAFAHLIDTLIDFRLEQLPQEEAVLLSIAQEWETETLEHQDGRTVSPDLLRQGTRVSLRELALDTGRDSWDG